MRQGLIVLCGGRSSRIGYPKALLPFGPDLMLTRVLRRINVPLTSRIVVAAAEQSLPELPSDVFVTRDNLPDRGPLEGLCAGLNRGRDAADAYYVTSCDVPLVRAEWVQALFDELATEVDIVVPVDDDHHHPLAAVYRPQVLPHIQELLAADQRRPFFLFDKVRTREVRVERLRQADPELASLANVNRREDYLAALSKAGYEPSNEIVKLLRD